jgi:cysteinyl-tRNA synthetase
LIGLDLFPSTREVLVSPKATELAQSREEARRRKDWKEADRLRGEILKLGYVVEDTPQGPRLLPRAS